MISRLCRAFIFAGMIATVLGFVNQSEAGGEKITEVAVVSTTH